VTRILPAACLLGLLAGCATVPQAPPGTGAGWAAYRAEAAAVTAWRLEGRVAVRHGDEGWSARLRWRHGPEGWRLELRDPLGRRALRLTADARGALLEAPGGVREWAPDAAVLLGRHAGLPVPVAALGWWARGLPAPGPAPRLETGPGGRPVRLEQLGWTVRYLAFGEAAPGVVLPRRLELSRAALRVRLVVDRWALGQDATG